MKNLSIISAVLFLSISVFAQETKSFTTKENTNLDPVKDAKEIKIYTSERLNLKGPAYKNYKPWKNSSKENTKVITLVKSKKSGLTGPDYKNYKPNKEDSSKKVKTIKLVESKRKDLKGLAYKNYKPWKNKK